MVYMECFIHSEGKSQNIEPHITYPSLQKLQTRFNCNLVSLDSWRVRTSTNHSSAFMFEFMNEILQERDTVIFKICFHRRVIDNLKLIFFIPIQNLFPFIQNVQLHSETVFSLNLNCCLKLTAFRKTVSLINSGWEVGSGEATECRKNQFN